MSEDALTFISDLLSSITIDYEFGVFTETPVPDPYFVGEYSETPPVNEDGMQETTMMLTGTSRTSFFILEEAKKKIRELFINGKTAILPNGNGIAVFYSNALNVPTNDMELKRIQINLTIKEWSVN